MAKTRDAKDSERVGRAAQGSAGETAARDTARAPTGGKTPPRAVRVPDRLWAQAKEAAEQRGENVSQVVKRALARYVRDTERRQAALDRFDRIRANIPPEQRMPEDEALREAGEEKTAMRADRDRAQAG